MVFSKKSHLGEIVVDHRASPGIPPEMAVKLGYDPSQVAEGKVFEAATMTCAHCGTIVVLNPLRVRGRHHCFRCNKYICDLCEAASRHPDYVHLPLKAVVDSIQSGKFTLGGTSVNPVLTPRKGD
jgi:hypothetical protein